MNSISSALPTASRFTIQSTSASKAKAPQFGFVGGGVGEAAAGTACCCGSCAACQCCTPCGPLDLLTLLVGILSNRPITK